MAEDEVKRYGALPKHPRIVNLLDVAIFPLQPQTSAVGLIFELFDVDVRQFLKAMPLQV